MNKIQLCSDEVLANAVRITDRYGFGDGLYVYDSKFGYGDINDFTFCVTDEGEGSNLGHICGYINESGDGCG